MEPTMSSRLTASKIFDLSCNSGSVEITSSGHSLFILPVLNACSTCALEWPMSGNVFKKLQRVSATKGWNYFYFVSNTIFKPRLWSRSIPKDCWMTENPSTLTLDLSNWTGRSFLAQTSAQSVWRCSQRWFYKCTCRVCFPPLHWTQPQRKSLSLAMVLPYTSDYFFLMIAFLSTGRMWHLNPPLNLLKSSLNSWISINFSLPIKKG